jgi:four helix bundle protein
MERRMLKSYRDLDVWKKSSCVVLDVYRATNLFPRSEQFGIVSQLRRAAYSIPANIAEGFGRRSTKELIQFLSIANGSLEELRSFLQLSQDLRYLSPADREKIEAELKSVSQMIEALGRSLKRRLTDGKQHSVTNQPGSAPNTGHGTRNTKTAEVAH